MDRSKLMRLSTLTTRVSLTLGLDRKLQRVEHVFAAHGEAIDDEFFKEMHYIRLTLEQRLVKKINVAMNAWLTQARNPCDFIWLGGGWGLGSTRGVVFETD